MEQQPKEPKQPQFRNKRDERTGRVVDRKKRRMRNVDDELKQVTQQKMAAELKIRGASYSQIAEHMGIDQRTVKRLVQRALEEYYDSHTEVVQRYLAINIARYDQVMRTWFPKALGGQRKDNVSDPVTGEVREVITQIEPDKEAAGVVLTAMRDLGRLLGNGQALRFEHTGEDGGPIVTAAVDAMDAARLVREHFGGAAAKSLTTGAVRLHGSGSETSNGAGNAE